MKTPQPTQVTPAAKPKNKQANKRLPDVNANGGRLLRCKNMRMIGGVLRPCDQALLYVEYGKGEIKCPHTKCKKITSFEYIEPQQLA